MLQNTTWAEAIKHTSVSMSSSEYPNGIQGHGVGVREVSSSNPGGTRMIFTPIFPGGGLGLYKQCLKFGVCIPL